MPEIVPTFFVGLGGTGREVLLRLRRFLYERYGDYRIPCVGYLWVDTEKGLYSQYFPRDHIARAIRFQNNEYIYAQVSEDAVRSYFKSQPAHPHIFSWLEPKLYERGADGITAGAKQFRSLGRLAFFHNYPTIRQRIMERLQEIGSQETARKMNDDQRSPFRTSPDSQVNVYIIASLAGGTGSGMCLDIPYLVRHLAPSVFPAEGKLGKIFAYFFLPEVYTNAEDVRLDEMERMQVQANGYAALAEMEYYCRKGGADQTQPWRFESFEHQGGRFVVQWDLAEPVLQFDDFPFSMCTLISNANREKTTITRAIDVIEMVAEALFLDFEEGGFPATRNARMANVEQRFQDTFADQVFDESTGTRRVIFSNPFSCRFSALGISKIYLDRERWRHAASYHLAMELLSELIGTPAANPTEEEATSAIASLALDRLVPQMAQRPRQLLQERIQQCQQAADFQNLISNLRKALATPEEAKWSRHFAEELTQQLSTEQQAWPPRLEAQVQQYGAAYAHTQLVAARRLCQQALETAQNAGQVPAQGLLASLAYLQEAEKLPSWPWGPKKIALEVTRQRLRQQLNRYGSQVISATLQKAAAVHLYQPLLTFLEQQIKRVEHFTAALDELINRDDSTAQIFGLRKLFNELSTSYISPRNYLLTRDFTTEKLGQLITLSLGDEQAAVKRRKLKEAIGQLLNPQGSMLDYQGQDQIRFEDLRNAVVELCYTELRDFLGNLHAIEQLHKTGQPKELLKYIIRSSSPYLPFLDDVFRNLQQRLSPLHYALYATADCSPQVLAKIMELFHEASDINFESVSQNRDAFVLLAIYNGIPLCSIASIAQLKESYDRYLRCPDRYAYELHTDKAVGKFPQIKKRLYAEARQEIELMQIVLLGVILRILRYDQQTRRFVFLWEEQDELLGGSRRLDCGTNLGEAKRKFQAHPQVLEHLKAACHSWYRQAKMQELVNLHLILEYYATYIFRPLEKTGVGAERIQIETPEHIVVQTLLSQLQAVLRDRFPQQAVQIRQMHEQLRFWIEATAEFVGPMEQRLLVYTNHQDQAKAMATLRYHSQNVVARENYQQVRLVSLNPVPNDQTPPPPRWLQFVEQWRDYQAPTETAAEHYAPEWAREPSAGNAAATAPSASSTVPPSVAAAPVPPAPPATAAPLPPAAGPGSGAVPVPPAPPATAAPLPPAAGPGSGAVPVPPAPPATAAPVPPAAGPGTGAPAANRPIPPAPPTTVAPVPPVAGPGSGAPLPNAPLPSPISSETGAAAHSSSSGGGAQASQDPSVDLAPPWGGSLQRQPGERKSADMQKTEKAGGQSLASPAPAPPAAPPQPGQTLEEDKRNGDEFNPFV